MYIYLYVVRSIDIYSMSELVCVLVLSAIGWVSDSWFGYLKNRGDTPRHT